MQNKFLKLFCLAVVTIFVNAFLIVSFSATSPTALTNEQQKVYVEEYLKKQNFQNAKTTTKDLKAQPSADERKNQYSAEVNKMVKHFKSKEMIKDDQACIKCLVSNYDVIVEKTKKYCSIPWNPCLLRQIVVGVFEICPNECLFSQPKS